MSKGSVVHIPPGVVHGARGKMRVLVVGIPDIAEDDCFEVADSLRQQRCDTEEVVSGFSRLLSDATQTSGERIP